MKRLLLTFLCFPIFTFGQNEWKVDTKSDWEFSTERMIGSEIREAKDIGGIIDLMGNGALLLNKNVPDSLYALNEDFSQSGSWTSNWKIFDHEIEFTSMGFEILTYGQKLDLTKGWKKFEHNPILSGENVLLPLNPENITEQTILLPPPPGGVPQDQSILLGRGQWEGKWILMFNHTPDAWPKNYYWSFAIADSLAPLKRGINPFSIPTENYPLFGPIDNQAPNDWLEVNGVFYAPDETYQSMAHLWISEDMISWVDKGVIENKVGTDPGIIFDGVQFHLFSENGNVISHCFLDIDSVKGYGNKTVLDVKDHTGDADVAYFNNQWHMFVDDGEHLFYKISYASTSPKNFPYEWKLEPEIYGPHNPEQGQSWDDDNEQGNRFGTGDADVALEGNTLYMFTERPIGAAFKELTELYNGNDQLIEANIYVDRDDDGIADDSTGWNEIDADNSVWHFEEVLKGKKFKVSFRYSTNVSSESPMIKSFQLSNIQSKPYK